MLKLFTEHPESLGMTYYEHMVGSLHYSYLFLVGSIKAGIHAILPFLYETSTTELVQSVRTHLDASRIKRKQINTVR